VENNARPDTEMNDAFASMEPGANYASVDLHGERVAQEVDRLIRAGYVEEHASWEALLEAYPNVVVSKIAAIVKTKDDGTAKTRIIIDMLRSMVNSFVKLHERIVLPRLIDVVSDLIDLAHAAKLSPEERQEVDQMVLDFADAFHSIGVHPEELPFQVFKLPSKRGYGVYRTVVFGGGGAPLSWGRGAALLGRSGQALFEPDQARIEIYVDDPWSGFRGTKQQIRRYKTRLLVWWLALGPAISWRKVQHGAQVKWIGALLTVASLLAVSIKLPAEYATTLQEEAEALMVMTAAPLKRVRALAGKCSWAGGFVPALGSMITPFWGAIADVKNASPTSKRAGPQHVPTARIKHALQWVKLFMTGQKGALGRVFPVEVHKAQSTISIEFDASPWGIGGVLFLHGRPVQYFAQPITANDINRFDIKVGESAGQALVENLAMLVGVRHWLPAWRHQRLQVRIRTDSSAAVGAWRKERSNTPKINAIVREMALDQAEGLYTIDVIQHLPGVLNTLADALSRMHMPENPAPLPPELQGCIRGHPEDRDARWWRTDMDNEASGST